mmetsp:Transcript_6264/g.15526  ORF Transcript_6264/g.15526 Transcript_6264/m.15526 type:complete len:231 (-) Transcript_6264:1006-1698(-)
MHGASRVRRQRDRDWRVVARVRLGGPGHPAPQRLHPDAHGAARDQVRLNLRRGPAGLVRNPPLRRANARVQQEAAVRVPGVLPHRGTAAGSARADPRGAVPVGRTRGDERPGDPAKVDGHRPSDGDAARAGGVPVHATNVPNATRRPLHRAHGPAAGGSGGGGAARGAATGVRRVRRRRRRRWGGPCACWSYCCISSSRRGTTGGGDRPLGRVARQPEAEPAGAGRAVNQ